MTTNAESDGGMQKDSRKRKADELSEETLADASSKNPALAKKDKVTETIEGNQASSSNDKKIADSGGLKEGKSEQVTNDNSEAASTNAACATADNDDQNVYNNMRYIIVRNDGKPESMIKLVGLKSLFAKQLPKMPRAYIARLVFDRRHTSLAILSDDPYVKDSDEEIIGGICYRAFEDMRFAEIAFCAVNANHQVKGYGTKLMNLLKKIGAESGVEYFITYADNYAIGYFKKQGFSKSIQMPKGRYFGLIKDYDGGTPMECYVHPSIDFTRIPEMLAKQRQFLIDRVKPLAQSRRVYPPPQPSQFQPNLDGIPRAHHAAARALAVPGIIQAGWTLPDLVGLTGQGKDADRQRSALKSELLAILRKIEEQQFSWPFREPVNTKEVPDYLDVIKEPIDLSTMEKRIRTDTYYKSKQMLYADLMLMVDNCKLYNEESSTYVHCAVSLEKYLGNVFRKEDMKR